MPKAPDTLPAKIVAAARRHAESVGVATARSLARAIESLDHAAAQNVAEALVEKGVWHRVAFTMNETRRVCYVPSTSETSRGEIRRRLCLLHFCCELPEPRPLQDPTELKKLVTPVARAAHLDMPEWVPCYAHRANRREPKRLSLLHVCAPGAMQRSIRQLDEQVSDAAFALWSHLAKHGGFVLSCLWTGDPADAAELSRWWRRRPPVSRATATATPIPVWVYPIPRIVVARPSAGKFEDE